MLIAIENVSPRIESIVIDDNEVCWMERKRKRKRKEFYGRTKGLYTRTASCYSGMSQLWNLFRAAGLAGVRAFQRIWLHIEEIQRHCASQVRRPKVFKHPHICFSHCCATEGLPLGSLHDMV